MITTERFEQARVWLDVLAAVEYVSDTHQPGLSVWDALEEAIRWWSIDRLAASDGFPDPILSELPWNDPDPLRSSIERLLAAVGPAGTTDGRVLSDVLTSALSAWIDLMAERYNDGHRFRRAASWLIWST